MSNDGELVFVAKRTDGLGERFRAILNAFALSKICNGKFKFHWAFDGKPKQWHAVTPVSDIFCPSFIEKFHVADGTELDRARKVDHFFKSEDKGLYVCDQSISKKLFKEPGDYVAFQKALIDVFRSIPFSGLVERANQLALEVELPENIVALHMRAGDLIYGRHKRTLAYTGKAISYPLAIEVIENLEAQGSQVLVFGQDDELIQGLAKKYGVLVASDLASKELNAMQSAFFDMILMSRCSSIIGGNSGFAIAASMISGSEYVNFRKMISQDSRVRKVFNSVSKLPALEGCSSEQVAFACKSALIERESILTRGEAFRLVDCGRAADPENIAFDFLLCWLNYESGNVDQAEGIAARLLNSENEEFRTFLRQNVRGRGHKPRFFTTKFPPEVISRYRGRPVSDALFKVLYPNVG